MKEIFKNKKFYFNLAFLTAEAAIYIAFLVIQLSTGVDPVILKYCGILLCLAYSAVNCLTRSSDAFLLAAAMLFTAVSDLIIFVIDDYYESGIFTFIIVQIIYFARIYKLLGKRPLISAVVRAAIAAVLIIVLAATDNLMPLTLLAAIYFTLLVCNAAESARLIKISPFYSLFTAGLVLFIGCDICVGLHNLAALNADLPLALQSFADNAMWAFYLPSQVLIVLSLRKDKNTVRPGVENEE